MIDRIFDYIEKYKFAIVGTVLFHVAIFLCTNFTTIDRPFNVSEEITEAEIPLDEIEFDEEMMKLLEINNKQAPAQEILNMAADENDSRNKSYEDFSTQELDQQVEMDAKALEEQYFKEWAETHPDQNRSDFADIQKEKENERERNKTPSNNIDNKGGNAYAGQVMVSFNLKGRDAYSLPVPGYTCNGSGTVTIQIKVDTDGEIRESSFIQSRSPGATTCMVNKAKDYARKSRFNMGGSGVQTGTITYQFKGQ
jgi:hypothetical protein